MRNCLFTFPTRDRPELLERSVRAWGKGFAAAGIGIDSLICDSSTDEGKNSRDLLSHLNLEAGQRCFLADARLRSDFFFFFGRSLGDEAAAKFWLGLDSGVTIPRAGSYGANRNLALLLGAGRVLATCDDDVLPDFRLSGESLDAVLESEDADPTQIFPYASVHDLNALSKPLDAFPISAYVPLADGAFPNFDGGERRTVLLSFGSWGDSGMGSSRFVIAGRNNVNPAIYADEEEYEAALVGRSFLRVAPSTVLGGLFLMTMHAIFDNRVLLPAFSPLGRGEDSLWAVSLSLFHPELALAYSPYAISHASPVRPGSGRSNSLAWDFGLNDLLLFMMAGNVPRGGVDTYAASGQRISAIASLPLKDFIEAIQDLRVAAAEARIASLWNLGEAWGWEPGFWAQDVKNAIASVKDEIASNERGLPAELPEARKLASWIGLLGLSLQAWPAIWQAALDLGPEFLEKARIKG